MLDIIFCSNFNRNKVKRFELVLKYRFRCFLGPFDCLMLQFSRECSRNLQTKIAPNKSTIFGNQTDTLQKNLKTHPQQVNSEQSNITEVMQRRNSLLQRVFVCRDSVG